MPLNLLNVFALVLPRPAILAFRSIPGVGARIVAIASIAARREQSAKMLQENYSDLPQPPAYGEGDASDES
jgi:hypothetical protein